MRILDATIHEVTRANLLAIISADPAAFLAALAMSQARLVTVAANYTLNEDTDQNAGILQTGGTITLPTTPTLALRCAIQGDVIQLTCAGSFRHVAAGGLQTIVPAASTLVFAPLSPAVAVCQCIYIGDEWFVFEI